MIVEDATDIHGNGEWSEVLSCSDPRKLDGNRVSGQFP